MDILCTASPYSTPHLFHQTTSVTLRRFFTEQQRARLPIIVFFPPRPRPTPHDENKRCGKKYSNNEADCVLNIKIRKSSSDYSHFVSGKGKKKAHRSAASSGKWIFQCRNSRRKKFLSILCPAIGFTVCLYKISLVFFIIAIWHRHSSGITLTPQ